MLFNRGVIIWGGAGGGLGRRGGGHREGHGPPLQFSNQTRSTSFILNIRDIAFYGISEIILTRDFTAFTVYALTT